MRHSPLPLAKSETALSLAEIERNAEGWLLDGEIRQHSKATLANRRLILDKLLWFLCERSYSTCGLLELRQFRINVVRGNDQEGHWHRPSSTTAVEVDGGITPRLRKRRRIDTALLREGNT